MPASSFSPFSISFQNEHIIYENIVKCTVKNYEFNYTYNPTVIMSGSMQNLKPFATGSSFQPYVTTIGLYNDSNDLVAVAKLTSPIPMSSTTDTTYIVRLDL